MQMIYAKDRNGVIGDNNQLPWNIPQDLQFFKAMTAGSAVIMGRKTWESLPAQVRPLPGRMNIIVTRQLDYAHKADKGTVHVCHSMPAALEIARRAKMEAWVIGGAQLFFEGLQYADGIWVTEIDHAYLGDTYAPVLGEQWQETSRESHITPDGVRFSFVHYAK